jgi:hypothetical protein
MSTQSRHPELDSLLTNTLLTCAYSEDGCRRRTVRILIEDETDSDVDILFNIILLCEEHVNGYSPTGLILADQFIEFETAH